MLAGLIPTIGEVRRLTLRMPPMGRCFPTGKFRPMLTPSDYYRSQPKPKACNDNHVPMQGQRFIQNGLHPVLYLSPYALTIGCPRNSKMINFSGS